MSYVYFDSMPVEQNFKVEKIDNIASYDMPEKHYHDSYEIYYQLSGERHYFIRDRVYHVQKGGIILINHGELHKTTGSGTPSFSRILIEVRQGFLTDTMRSQIISELFDVFRRNICLIPLTLSEQEFVQKLLLEIVKENEERQYGYLIGIKARMLELLVFLNRRASSVKADDILLYSSQQRMISRILGYIDSNYAERISLEDTAARFDMSRYYFCRVFKKMTGFTFVEYINAVRIKRAQELLVKTDQSVLAIGQQVGFESSTHFDRVFLKIVGIPPSRYRKNCTQI